MLAVHRFNTITQLLPGNVPQLLKGSAVSKLFPFLIFWHISLLNLSLCNLIYLKISVIAIVWHKCYTSTQQMKVFTILKLPIYLYPSVTPSNSLWSTHSCSHSWNFQDLQVCLRLCWKASSCSGTYFFFFFSPKRPHARNLLAVPEPIYLLPIFPGHHM